LLATLGVIISAITAIVIWETHHLIAQGWIVGALGGIWVVTNAVLRLKQDSLGAEGKYVDWWSIPHFTTGVLFGLFGLRLAFVVGLAIVWEIVEICAHTAEHPTNRITDIALAVAGWATANALAGGGFLLL
jgi:hypothetical protein